MSGLLTFVLTAWLGWQAAPAKNPAVLAPYYPTPELVVEKMLTFGELKPGETMWDLGSGDGRIVFQAAKVFGANAYGVELDNDLARQSADRVHQMALKNAKIIHGDLLKQDYSKADLLTVYLLPTTIKELVQPLLEKQLKRGARVVSHDFNFPGWRHTKSLTIDDDGEGRSHTLYLYVR